MQEPNIMLSRSRCTVVPPICVLKPPANPSDLHRGPGLSSCCDSCNQTSLSTPIRKLCSIFTLKLASTIECSTKPLIFTKSEVLRHFGERDVGEKDSALHSAIQTADRLDWKQCFGMIVFR